MTKNKWFELARGIVLCLDEKYSKFEVKKHEVEKYFNLPLRQFAEFLAKRIAGEA